MIQSMTGFGRGLSSSPTKKITVEIKSLNSKQADVSMRVPQIFRELEVETRNNIAASLERGKIDVTVNLETLSSEVCATINVPVLAEYKKQLENMGKELCIGTPADWYLTLMRLPDSMKTETAHLDPEDIAAFRAATEEAMQELRAFRLREGQKLYNFFISKIHNIGNLLNEVEP